MSTVSTVSVTSEGGEGAIDLFSDLCSLEFSCSQFLLSQVLRQRILVNLLLILHP